MNVRYSLPLALSALLLSACGAICVEGTGDPVRRTIEVTGFTKVFAEGSMDVVITQGTEQRVEVEAQPEIIELIDTDVARGAWSINTKKCSSTDAAFTVYITTPRLESVGLSGSGRLKSDDVFAGGDVSITVSGSGGVVIPKLAAKNVVAEVTGSGGIELGGSCAQLEVTLSGSGGMRALDLVANEVEAEVAGSGGVSVTAITTLEARITGSGSVEYRGKPQVESNITGSGSVSPVP